jgi:hypothetical protein
LSRPSTGCGQIDTDCLLARKAYRRQDEKRQNTKNDINQGNNLNPNVFSLGVDFKS